MTGLVGVFLAIAAGLIVVGSRRQLAMVVVLPFLVILGVQTWGIAAGKGVSPPSTVTGFPGLISYYIVQAIILGLALGIAEMIRTRRSRAAELSESRPERGGQTATWALIVNFALCAVVVAGFKWDRPLFDPGSVTKHSSSGSPPVLGIIGILLTLVMFVGLSIVTLRSRRARRANTLTIPSGANQTAGRAVL